MRCDCFTHKLNKHEKFWPQRCWGWLVAVNVNGEEWHETKGGSHLRAMVLESKKW